MTGYQSKRAAAQDKLDDDNIQDYKRSWIELTKGEIESWDLPDNLTRVEFAWFVETKLKERNA